MTGYAPRIRTGSPFRLRVTASTLALVFALAACQESAFTGLPDPPTDDPPSDLPSALAVEEVITGLDEPVYLTAPRGDDRLFVVERGGVIRVIRDGSLLTSPFLDIRPRVSTGGERGLLGLAFHPEFPAIPQFFLNYTDSEGATAVERYSLSADPDVADPLSAAPVLRIPQPFSNHNGGDLTFGPDGMLYIAVGDGGSGGDPLGHGQNRRTLLGTVLRIDVDGERPYAVPSDNPFVTDPDGRDEIWAFGLRNPWRIAFDEAAEVLYLADVGQSRWEEVNVAPAEEGGLNYGWNVMEGEECFSASECPRDGLTLPVVAYRTGVEGCAIIGGKVYRGTEIPSLAGHYFYSDLCAGWLRSFRLENGEAVEAREWEVGDLSPVMSFGIDGRGELYILSSRNGTVYRLVSGD